MEKKVHEIKTVHDYNAWIGVPDEHPLICIVNFDELDQVRTGYLKYCVYGIFLCDAAVQGLKYGDRLYKHSDKTMISVAPGQCLGLDDEVFLKDVKGWAMLFDPALISTSNMSTRMNEYGFLTYYSDEALYMTKEEHEIMTGCFRQVRSELRNYHDAAQRRILSASIEIMLAFCQRFYQRQFKEQTKGEELKSRLIEVVRAYYDQGRQHKEGVPTVKTVAKEMNISPNYLGDLFKALTETTPLHIIHALIMERARGMLSSGKPIADTAYELGYDYPHHFTRLFKKEFNMKPKEFQMRILNQKNNS